MEGKELVQKLIDGSAAIDRMRKEIDSVVGMVLGFLYESHDFSRFHFATEVFSSEKCVWRVMRDGYEHVRVACRLRRSYGLDSYGLEMAYSNIPGVVTFKCYDVKEVHDGLAVFVKGMAERFPEIEKAWRPLLDAAGK
jgi:hypothetical protein